MLTTSACLNSAVENYDASQVRVFGGVRGAPLGNYTGPVVKTNRENDCIDDAYQLGIRLRSAARGDAHLLPWFASDQLLQDIRKPA